MNAIKRVFPLAVTCGLALLPAATAQTPSTPPTTDQPVMFRATTELVQTDVTVLDKEGRFVEGLRREDFELRLDGSVKPIQFFERIAAGSGNEESQLVAAQRTTSSRTTPVARAPLDRGRTIFFYVDDLHLDLASLNATQKLVGDFIEEEMSQNDEVAIASASGQVGFLQQLTDNKTVLRLALQRIKLRPNSVRDLDRPPMTEYQALLIDKYDRDVTAFFVQETMRNNPGISGAQAENLVKGRSRELLQQADQTTAHTFSGLESLIRASTKLPGRKLVFFVSGGFLLNSPERASNLRRIASAAARTGTVIYTVDARGLVASLLDPSIAEAANIATRLAHALFGELEATQQGLRALARDTGGRPILNTNALGGGLSDALRETSAYYLLAWEPDQQGEKSGVFRTIEVKLIGKPELTVRVRRGFFDVEPAPVVAAKSKEAKPVDTTPDAELQEAIGSPYPERGIPISLSLNYLLTPGRGMMLTASMQIPRESLSFSGDEGTENAVVRIAGRIFNDRGQSGGDFAEAIKVSDEGIKHTHQILLGPGLYRVQVAAQDVRSGRIGSADAWIEVPNVAARHLALSSLIIGARRLVPATVTNDADEAQRALANISITRRFQRDADLRFFLFTYNAARADSRPDLAIQVQLLRDNRTVLKTALRKMPTENADLDGLPYAADLSLADLPPGRYALEVTVVDRVAGTSAVQQARFEIE
jgi:VWFA-related protein